MADLLYYPTSSLEELQECFPTWWSIRDPSRENYKWLYALSLSIDELAQALERIYLNSFLLTADYDGLLAEWAYVYDMREDLTGPLTADTVRSYILARRAEDGTLPSFYNTLLTILHQDPANAGGPILYFPTPPSPLTFPGGGGGLTFPADVGFTFPADGSGLGPLYEYTVAPPEQVGLLFAPGSGISFPDPSIHFADDGSGMTFDPAGAGLSFPSAPDLVFGSGFWLHIDVDYQHYRFTVTTKSFFAFDRGAFKRAIERFRQAHTTYTYVEEDF